jgi:hypothetical protein
MILLAGLLLGAPGVRAGGDDYDSRRAGHPLRIAAYVLHPIGVILDRLIFYPAWVIGGYEPIKTLVGQVRPPQEFEPAPAPIEPPTE